MVGLLGSCKLSSHSPKLTGTWKLITGTLVAGKDTTITDYTKGKSFIKIISPSHFAFMGHDLENKHDSSAFFSAGGGRYTLDGNLYTEYLEYCNAREWEGHHFEFVVTLHEDTLIQKGVEDVPGTAVSRINTEKYVRVGR